MDRLRLAKFLVESKADVNARNNDDNTALNMCFEPAVDVDPSAVQFLLDHKADPNAQNNAGMNPVLRWTKRRGDRAVLDQLLRASASLEVHTLLSREKPIHVAGNDIDLVFHLVDRKVRVVSPLFLIAHALSVAYFDDCAIAGQHRRTESRWRSAAAHGH